MTTKFHLTLLCALAAALLPGSLRATDIYGMRRALQIDALPVLDRNTRVGYEGSIDKQGGNADWDWHLYQDTRGEWVIFDVAGAGCIYNFVQHRYPASPEPTFRFYFDGDTEPRFSIRQSEFGHKYPFLEPLAGIYTGPDEGGRGPIWVIRSFVPMPFAHGCRITSDVKLVGPEKSRGEGGWGHVVYHSYPPAEGLQTFTGRENFYPLINLWKHNGNNPAPGRPTGKSAHGRTAIAPDGKISLFESAQAGTLTALRIYLPDLPREVADEVWVRIHWDGHERADVLCPIGCLGGNSLLYNDVRYLLMGASADGWFYNYFPMPFWQSATVTLENRSKQEVVLGFAEVQVTPNTYEQSHSGWFRSSDYYPRKYTAGADSPIATVDGTGKMVAAHVTCHGERSGIITCEGDVRVHIDGRRTPAVESDGSESYVCYGWGFPTPAECHPSGGYDGLPDNPWSMTRLCLGDGYPFYSRLHLGIESGESNNQHLEHSGIVFYYGQDRPTLVASDSLDLADKASVRAHNYKATGIVRDETLTGRFEDGPSTGATGRVVAFTGQSNFTVRIAPDNRGVVLRRLSDQSAPRQRARVYVDGVQVPADWYYADHNAFRRWLEDEFEIPAAMTAGKQRIEIRMEAVDASGQKTWNESAYTVFCRKNS